MVAIAAAAALISFSSCEKEEESKMNDDPGTLVEVASSNSNFTTLVAALQKAGLTGALEGTGPFTVFAPTNQAFNHLFNTLGVSGLEYLSPEVLTPVLLYHVVSEKVMSSDLQSGYVSTWSTGPANAAVSLMVDAENILLNGDVSVTGVDMEAENGVIHVIDEVLLPPTVVDLAIDNNNFSILVEAVVKAELAGTLSSAGPFTVFAPTNAAFEKLFSSLAINGIEDLTKEQLTPILLYHVVSGNVRSGNLASGTVTTLGGDITVELSAMVMINGIAEVVAVDIQGINGVVHVIDEVLLPPDAR